MKKLLLYNVIILGLSILPLYAHGVEPQEPDPSMQEQVHVDQKKLYRYGKLASITCASIAACLSCYSICDQWYLDRYTCADYRCARLGAILSALAGASLVAVNELEYKELKKKYFSLLQKNQKDGDQNMALLPESNRKIRILPAFCVGMAYGCFFEKKWCEWFLTSAACSALATLGFSRAQHTAYNKLKNKYDTLKQQKQLDSDFSASNELGY